MFKKILALITLFLLLGFLVAQQSNEDKEDFEDVEKEVEGVVEGEDNLIVGYCETFSDYAIELAETNNLETKIFPSTSFVLSALLGGEIDYALVGRKATQNELNDDIKERFLKEDKGYTLISDYRDFVKYFELSDIEIHTALEEDEVTDFWSFKDNIIYHNDVEEAVDEGEVVLIHWDDWKDEYGLFIPTDASGKSKKFRTPILYQHEDIPDVDIKD